MDLAEFFKNVLDGYKLYGSSLGSGQDWTIFLISILSYLAIIVMFYKFFSLYIIDHRMLCEIEKTGKQIGEVQARVIVNSLKRLKWALLIISMMFFMIAIVVMYYNTSSVELSLERLTEILKTTDKYTQSKFYTSMTFGIIALISWLIQSIFSGKLVKRSEKVLMHSKFL